MLTLLILAGIVVVGVFSWLAIIAGMIAAVWLMFAAINRKVGPMPTRPRPAIDRLALYGASAVGGYSGVGHSSSDYWDDWSRSAVGDASSRSFADWYVSHQVWDPLGKTDGGIAESYITHKIWP